MRKSHFAAPLLFGMFLAAQAVAQEPIDPLKRDLSQKQKKAQTNRRAAELTKEEGGWLNDVSVIISDAEREAFMKLNNSMEREHFIEHFWIDRDPTPDTIENEVKDEHYRRLAYADDHFSSGIRGSRTERGMIYIRFGPPDSIESHPTGGPYQRKPEEGGGVTSTYPFEIWRYRYLEGTNLGNEVEIEFLDSCGCGDYKVTIDPCAKDAMAKVPGAAPTDAESRGISTQAGRSNGVTTCGQSIAGANSVVDSSKSFDRMLRNVSLFAHPKYTPHRLDPFIKSIVRYNLLPFDIRTDIVKFTSDSVLVPIALQMKNREIGFVLKDGMQHGMVNIFGRITSINGKIAQSFEDNIQIDLPVDRFEQSLDLSSIYGKAFPLKPGLYKLDVVVKDAHGDHVGYYSHNLNVPRLDEEQGLSTSSLFLADIVEPVPVTNTGSGPFVIGLTKVRPKVQSADGAMVKFNRTQKAYYWMQIYNMERDKTSGKANAEVDCEVVELATQKQVMVTVDKIDPQNSSNNQFTLSHKLPVREFTPGTYQLNIKITDQNSNATITRSEKFIVE